MTIEEAIAFTERITFGWPLKAWGACVTVCDRRYRNFVLVEPYAPIQFTMRLESPHRDTGPAEVPSPGTRKTAAFAISESLEPVGLMHLTREQLERILFHMAKKMVIHELEESWLVDGVRIRDPHAEPTLKPATGR